MQNPFTTTFSKTPENTYISTEQTAEILENFHYDLPSESVFKITGVRGSGKTVLLGKVEAELESEENKRNGWLVFRLSPARDMLGQLAALLAKQGFIKEKILSRSLNISANVLGTGGEIGISSSKQNDFFDIGVELDQALQELHSQKKKALIGIDEVSRSPEMEAFASEFGKWLRAGYPIYLVCTGLYKNIEQLYNVKNLTFFRRASTIKTQPLNHIKMTEMYRQKLGVDLDTAKELSRTTKGYAYAFQELGALYFRKKPADTPDMILQQLKAELFAYAYEKIWEELSEKDRELVRILSEKPELSRKEILPKMSEPGNYPVYRDRLQKRGIITTRQGYAGLSLPFFGDYIREYGMS